MKQVEIFGAKYNVTENIYKTLLSVKNNTKCLEIVFVLGKQIGEIIKL